MTACRAYFEVVGDQALAVADKHFEAIDAFRLAALQIATELGGSGCRPANDGSIKFVSFAEPPVGWRKVQRDENGNWECKPARNTAVGKAAAKRMAETKGQCPSHKALTDALGFPGCTAFVIDGTGRVFFPWAVRVRLPTPRAFVSVGREEKADWATPGGLVEVPETQVQLALAQHNSAVDERKEAA